MKSQKQSGVKESIWRIMGLKTSEVTALLLCTRKLLPTAKVIIIHKLCGGVFLMERAYSKFVIDFLRKRFTFLSPSFNATF